jgi:hypothetical protein
MKWVGRVFLAITAMALAAPPSQAFKRIKTSSGDPVYWDDSSLPLSTRLNKKGSADDKQGSLAACDDAAESWNDVTNTSFSFSQLRRVSQSQANDTANAPDFKNLIVWRENNFPDEFGEGVLAVTISWFFTTGELVDSDIILNGEDFIFSDDLRPRTFDVYTVVLHEMGHVLGLDHVNKRNTIMYPFIAEAERKFLSNDDIKGVRAIYPP